MILICCGFGFVQAAPSYGTRMPEAKKVSLGLANYILYKRYLKDNYGQISSRQYFLNLSAGVFDWLAIDLKGGVGNVRARPVQGSPINYSSYLAGGYGFRLKFLDKNSWKAICGFQHISVHPHTVFAGASKHKAVLDDWQFSALGSYDLKHLTPYLGTRWSRQDYIHWTNGERKLEKSDLAKNIGLIFGADFNFSKKFWINVEGQFFDAEAVSFSVNYGF